MKKDIMGKWVAALRSGEFNQARGRLRTDTGFCCLGVLCEIFRRENPHLAQWNEQLRFEINTSNVKKKIHDDKLPDVVISWAHMNTASGTLGSTSLGMRNDDGVNFEDIADIIEKTWEEL